MSVTPTPSPQEIGKSRKTAGITQIKAARLARSTLATWQQWEEGTSPMPSDSWHLFRLRTKPRNLPSREHLQACVDDLIRRCQETSQFIAGFFWLSDVELFQRFRLKNTSKIKSELAGIILKQPQDFLVLHDLEALENAATQMGLPSMGSSHLTRLTTIATSRRKSVDTGLTGAAWSLLGLIIHREEATHISNFFVMIKLVPSYWPALFDPEAMPITEDFIEPRGLMQPLGQWFPAFQDTEGRVHDALDLCIATLSYYFTQTCFGLWDRESVTAATRGYLARQAAHAYDVFTRDFRFEPTLFSFSGSCLAGVLMVGASMTQNAWSGPDPLLNQRPFLMGNHAVRELVYLLTLRQNNDDICAEVLKRMREEGHDIVVLHGHDAKRNRQDRPYASPLHHFAQSGFVQCVRELLAAGADASALVYEANDTNRRHGKSVYDFLPPDGENSEAIAGMLRASEAREVATQSLRDMGLEGFRTLAPS